MTELENHLVFPRNFICSLYISDINGIFLEIHYGINLIPVIRVYGLKRLGFKILNIFGLLFSIHRHKQSRSLRPTRKFTPSSVKLKDSVYTPGRFSTTSAPSLEDYDMVPIRRVKMATPQTFFKNDEDRKISIMSNISAMSADYCEIMTDFDEAQGENESLTGSNNSAQNALSLDGVGLTDLLKTTDVEMEVVATKPQQNAQSDVSVGLTDSSKTSDIKENVKRNNAVMLESVCDTGISPPNVSTIFSERL